MQMRGERKKTRECVLGKVQKTYSASILLSVYLQELV